MLKSKIIDILLYFNIHNWAYSTDPVETGTIRVCLWSGEKQEFVYEGSESGWSDGSYWQPID